MRYLKWVFGTEINKSNNASFEVNKVITCDIWDPTNPDWDKRGGFNFTNEECALRWMSRGDTLYEVEIPEDGEIIEVENMKTPGGILVSNKIILKNPTPISNDMLMDFYKKSKLPDRTYFECIGLLSARGYEEVATKIINERINKTNKDAAIQEFNESIKPWHTVDYNCYNKVKKILEEKK